MNFIEPFFIEDLTLCDDIIEYFKNLPPNKKFEGRIGLSNSHIDYSKKRSIETIFEWNENGNSLSSRYAIELGKCCDQYIKKYEIASDCINPRDLIFCNSSRFFELILNLDKNVGSQKAIFFGLKYLQKIIKKKDKETIISILDSDGEDNPNMVKKLIKLVNLKKDYFIFASRKKRTESNFLKALNPF